MVEGLPEVADSLVVHLEGDDPDQPMGELILFVALTPGVTLDDDLRATIVRSLRRDLSPRHVPDAIHTVPTVPRTLSGKKLEVPVKRILGGAAAERLPVAARSPIPPRSTGSRSSLRVGDCVPGHSDTAVRNAKEPRSRSRARGSAAAACARLTWCPHPSPHRQRIPAPARTNRGQVSVVRTGAGFDVKMVGDAGRYARIEKTLDSPAHRDSTTTTEDEPSNAMITAPHNDNRFPSR